MDSLHRRENILRQACWFDIRFQPKNRKQGFLLFLKKNPNRSGQPLPIFSNTLGQTSVNTTEFIGSRGQCYLKQDWLQQVGGPSLCPSSLERPLYRIMAGSFSSVLLMEAEDFFYFAKLSSSSCIFGWSFLFEFSYGPLFTQSYCSFLLYWLSLCFNYW